jgi:hypothetical protein
MFDTAKIMKDAWSIYRRNWCGARPATEALRLKEFGKALRNAWVWAKQEVTEVAKTAAEKFGEQIAALKVELDRIDARPFGMRIEADRAVVVARIATISRRAA